MPRTWLKRMRQILFLSIFLALAYFVVPWTASDSNKEYLLFLNRESEKKHYKLKEIPSTKQELVNEQTKIFKNSIPAVDNIKTRFEERLIKVKEVCSKVDPDYQLKWESVKAGKPSLPDRFIASYKHRALMCIVLKAGSSTWHDIFWRLRAPEEALKIGFWEKGLYGNVQSFKDLDVEKKIEIWKSPSSTRILNVRHPFARLISGWKDKFSKAYFYDIWFKEFPELLNYPNKYGTWRRKGQFMEWRDFAHYVADHGEDHNKLDAHFWPVSARCDPCQSPFNFITKLETFDEDARWILENQLSSSTLSIHIQNRNGKNPTSIEDTIRKHFQELSPEIVGRIYKIYESDFQLFGYTFNQSNLTAGGW